MPAVAAGRGSWPQGWKAIARRANYQRLILARHLSMPSFMTGKRSKLVTVAAAGTIAVAAGVSAATATLLSGPPDAAAGAADVSLAVVDHPQVAARAAQGGMMTAAQSLSQFHRMRASLAGRQREHDIAVARAAMRAAAAKAAARRAAAARAAAAKAAAQQAAQATAQQQPAPAAQPSAQQAVVTAAPGSPQQIAEQMLSQYGWPASQFSCLQPLWERESGWSVTAENPSSGAYGIPQALPGSQMASAGADWQTDAATQIHWGLSYIQSRYGSPCGAWAHEEADGWY
jgi:hypothetical protein